MRTKGLQLVIFLIVSVLLIPPMGPLGAAAAVVASDLLIQFGVLGLIIIQQTLARPGLHVAILGTLTLIVVSGGWALGALVRAVTPGTGVPRFLIECALWSVMVVVIASPLANPRLRARLNASVPT